MVQSSPDVFPGTRKEPLSITFLSDFGYLEYFRRYSRSKSKVVKMALNFGLFSPSQISGACLPKVIFMFDPYLAARHMKNVL